MIKQLKVPSGTLSTAEAIPVVNNGLAMAAYFGYGELKAADLAAGNVGTIIKDPMQDKIVWAGIFGSCREDKR